MSRDEVDRALRRPRDENERVGAAPLDLGTPPGNRLPQGPR
ncbi:hypothetical protein [Actinomadura viridis]|uniref:Uncharacterized protein n=1 Tax=Actinomadura viridis TaxID=58110 RepID=A0A931DHX2_9ACTN|nr:hypothetical protein [Actinomadura viridis]MBG6087806.1 hypothetical protein [Actinomadura viridis]